jgi:hypothetical protein
MVFMIKGLLEEGVPYAQILEQLTRFFKPSHAKLLIKDAQSHIQKIRVQKAKIAVAHDGLSIEDAAKKYRVNIEVLKDEITGAKKKRRKKNSLADDKRDVSHRYRSNSAHDVKMFREYLRAVEDGEKTPDEAREFFLHVQSLRQGNANRVDEWLERLAALRGTMQARS